MIGSRRRLCIALSLNAALAATGCGARTDLAIYESFAASTADASTLDSHGDALSDSVEASSTSDTIPADTEVTLDTSVSDAAFDAERDAGAETGCEWATYDASSTTPPAWSSVCSGDQEVIAESVSSVDVDTKYIYWTTRLDPSGSMPVSVLMRRDKACGSPTEVVASAEAPCVAYPPSVVAGADDLVWAPGFDCPAVQPQLVRIHKSDGAMDGLSRDLGDRGVTELLLDRVGTLVTHFDGADAIVIAFEPGNCTERALYRPAVPNPLSLGPVPVHGMAVDDMSLYTIDAASGSGGSNLLRIDRKSGIPQIVDFLGYGGSAVAVDSSEVYAWRRDRILSAWSKTTGRFRDVFTADTSSDLVLRDGFVYTATTLDGGRHVIRVPSTGGPLTDVAPVQASTPYEPYQLRVDDDFVYWLQKQGELVRVRKP